MSKTAPKFGGTGLDTFVQGDILYAGSSSPLTTLSRLAAVATGNVLISGGVGADPSWNKVTSAHVDSSVALTGGNLSQFAATTSAQLAGVISDETGSGALVFGTNASLTRPLFTGGSRPTSGDGIAVYQGAGDIRTIEAANFAAAKKILRLTGARVEVSTDLTYTSSFIVQYGSLNHHIGENVELWSPSSAMNLNGSGALGLTVRSSAFGSYRTNLAMLACQDYAAGDARLYVRSETGNDVIIGNGTIRTDTFTSTVAIGTAPLVVTSTTKVANLNADSVDGVHIDTLTNGYVPYYNSTGTKLANSPIYTDGTSVMIGTTTASGLLVSLNNSTAASGTERAAYLVVEASPAGSSSASFFAVQGYAYTTTSQDLTGNVRAGDFTADIRGTGLRANVDGFSSSMTIHSSSACNVTTAIAIRAATTQLGSGTITNAYGVYSNVGKSGSGTITNAYGCYVHTMAGLTGTAWGFYQNNTHNNYFGGKIGVGNTPTAFLDAAASTTAAASIRVRSGTAPTSPNSGDLWYDGTNLKFRDSTTTRTISWT